jgi:hypothetical protein
LLPPVTTFLLGLPIAFLRSWESSNTHKRWASYVG